MAFITDLANVHKNRPFKPRYARTQATAQAWKLGTTEAAIVPGMCMTLGENLGEVVPATAGAAVAGFCGTFQKELDIVADKNIALWVLSPDATFATETFDTTATWTNVDPGDPLYSNANGLLTPTGSEGAIPAARFLGMEGTSTIVIAGCL